MDDAERILTSLQMGDSFFPSGAFAHSSGLETFVADGLVSGREELVHFIESYLVGLVGRCDLVFVRLAYASAVKGDAGEVVRLDRLAHAMKLSKELRGASTQMGRQVLQVMRDLYPSPLLHSLWQSLEARELRGHHPVVFGSACGSMGMGMENTLLAYLYSLIASLVSAGVRLIPLGHSDGQRTINELKPLAARMTEAVEMLKHADISTFAPALEVRAMQHEGLSTRLFKS
jgi:urease accessory protein